MEISVSGAHAQSGKNFFFFLEITCFRLEKPFEFLISAEKTLRVSAKTFFFFGEHKI